MTEPPDRPPGRGDDDAAWARRLAAERAAREAAERAADRAQRLYALAQALSRTLDPEEVAEAALRAGVLALGAAVGLVWLVRDGALALIAAEGCERDQDARYARIPLDAQLPAAEALRRRRPLLYRAPDELAADVPDGGGVGASPFRSWAVVPLLAGDQPLGALWYSFAEPRAFDVDERAILEAISSQASLALERSRLFEAERRARAHADEFLAMLGHELRNPLAPLSTAIQLMRAKDDAAFRREREVIERQVGHLTRLLDDLLDVSRITRGKVQLARAPVDVAEAIAKAIEMASPLYEKQAHHLRIEVPRGALIVDGDPVRLAQIFQNLLTNAAKYTPRGGHVEVRAARDGGDVVVRVIDDGTGLAPELLPRVFDLFVQAPRAIDRAEGGLGLGLTLVRRLVELHGGRVEARSDGPDRGSEFIVRLPAAAAAPRRPEPVSPPTPGQPRERRVLVVDDNVDAAEILAEALRELGFDVAVAHDGPTALDAAARFAPHAAVLDLGLPVMDGFELAQRLRARWAADTLRLVAVTGYGQDSDRARSAAAGFDAHLVKPVDLRALVEALSRTT